MTAGADGVANRHRDVQVVVVFPEAAVRDAAAIHAKSPSTALLQRVLRTWIWSLFEAPRRSPPATEVWFATGPPHELSNSLARRLTVRPLNREKSWGGSVKSQTARIQGRATGRIGLHRTVAAQVDSMVLSPCRYTTRPHSPATSGSPFSANFSPPPSFGSSLTVTGCPLSAGLKRGRAPMPP